MDDAVAEVMLNESKSGGVRVVRLDNSDAYIRNNRLTEKLDEKLDGLSQSAQSVKVHRAESIDQARKLSNQLRAMKDFVNKGAGLTRRCNTSGSIRGERSSSSSMSGVSAISSTWAPSDALSSISEQRILSGPARASFKQRVQVKLPISIYSDKISEEVEHVDQIKPTIGVAEHTKVRVSVSSDEDDSDDDDDVFSDATSDAGSALKIGDVDGKSNTDTGLITTGKPQRTGAELWKRSLRAVNLLNRARAAHDPFKHVRVEVTHGAPLSLAALFDHAIIGKKVLDSDQKWASLRSMSRSMVYDPERMGKFDPLNYIRLRSSTGIIMTTRRPATAIGLSAEDEYKAKQHRARRLISTPESRSGLSRQKLRELNSIDTLARERDDYILERRRMLVEESYRRYRAVESKIGAFIKVLDHSKKVELHKNDPTRIFTREIEYQG